MSKESRKILIAAGGTGGHLFPAQALARELLEQDKSLEILFAGAALSTNRCFQKKQFSFQDISASTPFKKSPVAIFKAALSIIAGIRQSFQIIARFKPELVIGFGSFHAFPLLFAALCKRVPILLFESNSLPGKVNRFFSFFAKVTAIQFPMAATKLFGQKITVETPLWNREFCSSAEARRHFGLEMAKPTLLVFGGSLGAVAINELFSTALQTWPNPAFQVIHITGKKESAEAIRAQYAKIGLTSCVKEFEERMPLAWQAADLAVCRAGAATVAEQIAFEIPAIFIPYPHGAEDHQTKNATFVAREIRGGVVLPQNSLDALKLRQNIEQTLSQLAEMKVAIQTYKQSGAQQTLSSVVFELLKF